MKKNSQNMKKNRMSNIELLRIIAMALIIGAHLSYYGGAFYHTEGIDKFVASLFLIGGKLGVSLFVMIGSVFMAKKNVSFGAIFKVLLTVALINSVIAMACFASGNSSSILNMLNPIKKYWFVDVYVGLMLVSPWLNKLIDIMDYKMYKNLIIALTVLCAFYPTIFFNGVYTNQFLWFVYLYFLINFILKYGARIKEALPKIFRFASPQICILLLGGGVQVIVAYLISRNERFLPMHNSGSVIMLSVALLLFLFFYRLKIEYNCFINWIAKGTFVAYLIHDNAWVRSGLWNDLLRCSLWYNLPDFALYGFFSVWVVLLFGAIVAVAVDKIVQYLLNMPISKKLISKIDSAYNINRSA